jgi:predicted site-specific integrase-resolvase
MKNDYNRGKELNMLRVQEAMKKLGISRTALYDAMAAGKLKYVVQYGKRLFDERSLAEYVPRSYPNRTVNQIQQDA